MKVQAGGGVRDRDRLTELFATGVERVVLGSLAILDRATVSQWLNEVQAERLVLAFDVRIDERNGDPMTMTHGWREASGQVLWELMDFYLRLGALDFLCTDIRRDGTLAGPNTALYRECVQRYPKARFIASGGISSVSDLRDLATTGVAGVVTGKALLDGRLTLQEIEQFSRDA
jgi:phosphoribosylformimino-5-aminoimidazole carboxamide ribotide isomerase